MDDKDSWTSKKGASVLVNPSAIARRKRMEILRFKKLSNTTGLLRNDSQISLDLKRAWPPAYNELCNALEDPKDMGTSPPKLQREEGSDCEQRKGTDFSASPRLLQDHRTDLWTIPEPMGPMVRVDASEQVAVRESNLQLPSSAAVKEDGSTSYDKVDFSALLKVTGQSNPYTSYSSSCSQGCPPSGMLLMCGQRREMLDRASIVPSFANLNPDLAGWCSRKGKEEGNSSSDLHFFAVYDGQGGSQASQFCMERLHLVLAEELSTLCAVQDAKQEILPHDWKTVMASCFLRMDKEMGAFYRNGNCHEYGSSALHSGGSIALECVSTTAVTAVVSSWQIVIATCGDSRAVLSRGGKAVSLSLTLEREREDETNRLKAAGQQVLFRDGDCVGGFLDLSRAMGNQYLKHFMVPELEVMCIQRSEDDECLILASDGLWDVIDDHTSCEIAQKCLATTKSTQAGGMHDVGDNPASIAAAAILLSNFDSYPLAQKEDEEVEDVKVEFDPKEEQVDVLKEAFDASLNKVRRQREGDHQQQGDAPKEAKQRATELEQVAIILANLQNQEETTDPHPYVPITMESLDIKEVALVDSGACFNVISFTFFERLKDISLDQLLKPVQSFTVQRTIFVGKVDLKIQVGSVKCGHEFYVMPPKGMIVAIILGTPWQNFKAVPDWDTNAILFKQEDGYISQHFVQPWELQSNTQHLQTRIFTDKDKAKVEALASKINNQ
ncbi:hypothetical protein L7F22_037948 [Adiantum nelumboides]|nr:hypothetical protein [Adiantum nelumboides]